MLAATFRPWHAWPKAPTPAGDRLSRYRFKAKWSATLDLLEHELGALGATDIVVQLALQERDIRNDGWPRAGATPSSPGAILSFGHPQQGRVQYAVDRYEEWQHNLRAIGLALEALRAVDRYGVSSRGEQYAGWKALPASTTPAMNVEQAVAWVAGISGLLAAAIQRNAQAAREALRIAAMRTHPDNGGSTEEFQRVQEAKRVLSAHHGGLI